MHPELFRFTYAGHERGVYSYGVMILVGMTVGILIGARRAPRYGVQPFDEVALGLLTAVAGVFGSWLLYIALHFAEFRADPIGHLQHPGLVFYGGFIAALAVGTIYMRAYEVPLGGAADAAALALPFGHACGRIGCFLAGCCYGRPTDSRFGVIFPHGAGHVDTPAGLACAARGPIHPVQLYEVAGLIIVGLIIMVVGRRAKLPSGGLFLLYLGLYAILRLTTEGFRGDFVARGYLVPGLLTTSQTIAVLMLGASIAAYLHLRRRSA